MNPFFTCVCWENPANFRKPVMIELPTFTNFVTGVPTTFLNCQLFRHLSIVRNNFVYLMNFRSEDGKYFVDFF